jgi:RHS repeat-associated protein
MNKHNVQCLEERFLNGQGQTAAINQYVWDLSYIDAPVVRFRDGNADSDYADSVDNILYYTTDANHNVTTLVKASDGSVVERYTYDAYGKAVVHDAAWSDVAVAPRKGVGLTFDDSASTNTYVDIAGTLQMTSFTVAAWIKRGDNYGAGNNYAGYIVSSSDNYCWTFYISGNQLRLGCAPGLGSVVSTVSLDDTEWHFVAATYAYDGQAQNGDVTLYIDGALDSTHEHLSWALNSNGGHYIISSSGSTWAFDGQISEAAVWSAALGGTAIAALYNSSHGCYGYATQDMLIGYHMDEGRGTTLADYSGSNHPGTLHDNISWSFWSDPVASAYGNSVLYAGYWRMGATGALLARNHVLDVGMGRFDSEDPALSTLNLYVYCGCEPINILYPFGLECLVSVENAFDS